MTVSPEGERRAAMTLLPSHGMLEMLLPVVSRHSALVGHSLGGLCSIPLAAQLGSDLKHLVLMEPGVVPWAPIARFGAWWYRRSVVDRKERAFANRGPWYWRLHDPDGFSADAMAMVLQSDATTDIETPRALAGRSGELYPLPFERISAKAWSVRRSTGGSSCFAISRGRPWARTAGIALSAVLLTDFPIGMSLGILGMGVLLDEEVTAALSETSTEVLDSDRARMLAASRSRVAIGSEAG